MKKNLVLILFILTFESLGISRDINFRRLNENILQAQFEYNSTTKIEILKSLSAYDYQQAKENSGRLFIRDKIIFP